VRIGNGESAVRHSLWADFANAPKKNATEQGAETHATFERMLKSAHSDYSRSRVSLQAPRSANAEPKGKRVRIHPTRAGKFSAKAGQTVIVPAKGSCSRHPEQALQPTGECVERRLIDLVFTKHGVRKTTIQYVGKQKTCPVCRVKFSPPTIRRLGPRIFGHRLQAWAVYQRIALRMPLETISRTMSDLFSENVNRVTIMDFVAQFAAEFAGTERRLLKRIVSGSLIHVDETKINIHGENQYVWVLTDGCRAIFRRSLTRETRLIRDLIRGYQGTLVSDFYGGYDAVPCRQQKCIVHLIRDLNDDLWKNPFNDEYNQFTATVRDLLVPMLGDAQRFGLKAFYLRKHKLRVGDDIRFSEYFFFGH
jgi:transposase